MKKVLASSLLGLALMMSGCGDSEGESVLETQQMLDNGNFTGVIAKLESSASTPDDYINLASAYMGKAGLTLTSIITAITSGGDNNSGDSGFATFVTGISAKANSTALTDLTKATKYYQKVVGLKCANLDANLSSSQKDVCLFIGLTSTSTAAVTIDLIAGDISTFGDGSGGDDKLTASTCAMKYALDGSQGNCTITQDGNVTFAESHKTYKSIIVMPNSSSTKYNYLINDNNRTVLTKNYCQASSFATRTDTDTYNASASPKQYACPINESADANDTTTAGVLVDVLNNGLGAISGAASSDTQGDVDQFKCEVLGGNYDGNSCNNASLDNNVSEQDIITYLNSQN